MKKNKKLNILMMGPARSVKGGMTTVVDGYFNAGLEEKVNLKYIETVNDKGNISKIIKMIIGFLHFIVSIWKSDIVHIHMASRLSSFRKGVYVRISKFLKRKVIIHIHGAEYKIFYGKECNERKKKYVRRTLQLADYVIVLSEEWKDYFQNLTDENKIIVLYNAVIIPKDFKKDYQNKKILFLGRIGDRKGIFDLLDVVKELALEFEDIKLYIGGDGEIERLNNYINQNNMTNFVEYIGWTSGEKKDKFLKESSIYILPSYNEGMPMSVLEGMAYMNATISTYVGGIPKVINDHENGFLIEPGDKLKLKEVLIEIFSDNDLKKKVSVNARNTIINKFSAEKNLIDLLNIYESYYKM